MEPCFAGAILEQPHKSDPSRCSLREMRSYRGCALAILSTETLLVEECRGDCIGLEHCGAKFGDRLSAEVRTDRFNEGVTYALSVAIWSNGDVFDMAEAPRGHSGTLRSPNNHQMDKANRFARVAGHKQDVARCLGRGHNGIAHPCPFERKKLIRQLRVMPIESRLCNSHNRVDVLRARLNDFELFSGRLQGYSAGSAAFSTRIGLFGCVVQLA